MVTARNDFEEFLLQQGFPPERANYWASALERAHEAVTVDVLNSTLEITLERQANYILTVVRDEFVKRDIEITSIHRDIADVRQDIADIRQEIALLGQGVDHLAAMRREDREREQADRRERRAFTFGMTGVVLGLTGAVIAALLRLFGAI